MSLFNDPTGYNRSNNINLSGNAPTETDKLWIDTSVVPYQIKSYNPSTSTWELASAGGSSGGGVKVYSSLSAFPSTANAGDVGVNMADDQIYTYDSTKGWTSTAGAGGVSINDTSTSTTTVYSSSKVDSTYQKSSTALSHLTQSGSETSVDISKINHSNRGVLDKITQSGTEPSIDLSQIATNTNNIANKQNTLSNAATLGKLTQSGTETSVDISEVHHTNRTVLDNLSDTGSGLLYKGSTVGGNSGASINDSSLSTSTTYSSSKIDSTYQHAATALSHLTQTGTETSIDISTIIHSNRATIDKLMQSGSETSLDISKINHANRTALDALSQSGTETNIDISAIIHSNRSVLNKLTQSGTETSLDVSAIVHSNRTVLDNLSDVGGNLNYKNATIGGVPKYAGTSAMPANANLYDICVNTSDSGKLYQFKTQSSQNLVTPMTADNAPAPEVSNASSINSTQFPSHLAFNGTTTDSYDCWASSGTPSSGSPEWISLDFGSAKTISSFGIVSRNDSSSRSFDPSAFVLQSSTDGTTWTDQLSVSAATFSGAGIENDYTLPSAVTARYWRLKITATYGNIYAAVGELKLLGSTNAWVLY